MLLVLVLGATADDGPLPPGASGAGMFWFRIGIGQEGSHGSAEVVLDGVGIRLAPFLRDRRTHDREAVNEALGMLRTALQPNEFRSETKKTH